MDAASDGKSPKETARIGTQIFGDTFAAPVIAVGPLLLAALVALLALVKTKVSWSPLWLSGAVWIAFIVYWSAAAQNAAPTRTSESPASRRIHQLLMYGALVLVFLHVPGLRQRCLPNAPAIVAGGLALQVASAFFAVWARRHLGRNYEPARTDGRVIPSTRTCWVC
jgi:cobalamin synthase